MVKGKHGRSAAIRHDAQSGAEQLAASRVTIARLTQELDATRAVLDAQKTHYREAERQLLAERDGATSPQMEALQATLKKTTEQRDQWESKHLRNRRKGNLAMVWIFRHLRAEHGLTGPEALAHVMDNCGLDSDEAQAFSDALGRNMTFPRSEASIKVKAEGW